MFVSKNLIRNEQSRQNKNKASEEREKKNENVFTLYFFVRRYKYVLIVFRLRLHHTEIDVVGKV